MNRISINAKGQPYFDLTYGDGQWNRDKAIWKFNTTHGILMQAVAEGYATEKVETETYGTRQKWFTNDGKLIRELYTPDGWGVDTWNPYELTTGIFNLSKDGAYEITIEDIQAACLAKAS